MSNQRQLSQEEHYTQVVKDFLCLLEEKNIPALIDLWADDGINYYPYSSGMSPEKVVGKQAIYETWKGIPELFESLSFSLQDIYTDVTKQTAIVRCDAHNIMKGDTERYDNTYVCIFVFNDKGKIKEYYEYFNPITTGVTYGLLRVEFLQGKETPQSQ
jgi:ketosteroid isomerase-like protein